MPPPFPEPTPGKLVKSHPSGFPCFFDKRKQRVVTADPWAFFRHLATKRLGGELERRALSYIDQALDFYEAAGNPRIKSKPVLFYYSFLNLAKTALLIRKVRIPYLVRHGISDPKTNQKSRLRFEGQLVRFEGLSSTHSEIFPAVVHMLGSTPAVREIRIVDLLAQIPSIHRTLCRATGRRPAFLPIRHFRLLTDGSAVWSRLILDATSSDVPGGMAELRRLRRFRGRLHRRSSDAGEVVLETRKFPGRRRGVDPAILKLANELKALGASSLLAGTGYRQYMCLADTRQLLPPLAAGYAVMFYLGSVTRYKPDVFKKILTGGFAWVVEEFLSTYPPQFVYGLASELAGVDVVRPYAALT